MRNWNNNTTPLVLKLIFCFYFTYEELKHDTLTGSNIRPSTFLLYLWGIETNIGRFIDVNIITVFTLPMRNWNTFITDIFLTPPLCFYFTYEELKQDYNLFLEERGESFYFTYEELKLSDWLANVGQSDWSFYFTYEELKHEILITFEENKRMFLLYLWGIETIL